MTQLIVLISVAEVSPGFSEDFSEPRNSLVAKQKWTQEKDKKESRCSSEVGDHKGDLTGNWSMC